MSFTAASGAQSNLMSANSIVFIIDGCGLGTRLEHQLRPTSPSLCSQDGRLQKGDRILAVNGETFTNLTRERALTILTQLKIK